jgi:CheY-like chemotaxis protein
MTSNRILIAEDEHVSAELAKALILKLGMEVDEVADGCLAFEKASEREYAAILMDVELPGMSGIEATQRIRAEDGPNSATRIIAVTTDGGWEECLAAGMDAHVAKPYRSDELYCSLGWRVRAALRRSHSTPQHADSERSA